LAGALNAFPDNESAECKSAQAIGYYCGCPLPADTCTLCPDGLTLKGQNDVELDGYIATDYISLAPPNQTMTCEFVESLALSWPVEDDRCEPFRADLATKCTCTDPPPPEVEVEEGAEGSTDAGGGDSTGSTSSSSSTTILKSTVAASILVVATITLAWY